ncbi:MAG: glycerol-3-phosphate dehydrogenase/oxidase [Leptospiraceae bacterium]|nr:glycerol-3-phosphate dehydrogenase/oxidase [Leptospiraceae bacterium]
MFSLKINTAIQGSEDFDILIIGGGILGLAIAREAAERGHSVGLIEKNDFYCATSASTSKLIHGGLRYLENFEFDLVRESLKERRILMLSASHLVKPLSFLIPVLPWTKPNPFFLFLGLKTYDLLSFDRNRYLPEESYIPNSKFLGKSEIDQILPELRELTKGGFLYYDALNIHPERLALAFLKSAHEKGAKFYNHVEIENFLVEKNHHFSQLRGVEVKDTLTGKTATFKAKVFVNATGPWADLLLSRIFGQPVKILKRSTGIHFLTKPIWNVKSAVLLRTKSKRHFFIIPWLDFSLIGPTDTPFDGDPDDLQPTKEEIETFIQEINQTFEKKMITKEQIQDVIIGIRPLLYSQNQTYLATRKHQVFSHKKDGWKGLFSVVGGKWTTARKIGEDVLQEIYMEFPEFQRTSKNVDTSILPLFGSPGYSNPFSVYEDFALKEFKIKEINSEQHKYLISLYGTEHIEILKLIHENPKLAKPIDDSFPNRELYAQVQFAFEYEGARTLEDIVRRRIGYGTYGVPDKNVLTNIAEFVGKSLKWTKTRVKKEVENTLSSYPTEVLKQIKA